VGTTSEPASAYRLVIVVFGDVLTAERTLLAQHHSDQTGAPDPGLACSVTRRPDGRFRFLEVKEINATDAEWYAGSAWGRIVAALLVLPILVGSAARVPAPVPVTLPVGDGLREELQHTLAAGQSAVIYLVSADRIDQATQEAAAMHARVMSVPVSDDDAVQLRQALRPDEATNT
jgi:uncharacterized membrane protein